ncbi:geranylgeranylglyceryl/heptaprenylglyceryl phosphate synthase, partial [Bacillus mycoides]|uniref:geranylgeranylglyceryl/heptaprenylglyceryl phosphate synthase n=1 Tax=Bacillus mycoides TaxID=1405 RepID=UPI001C92D91F
LKMISQSTTHPLILPTTDQLTIDNLLHILLTIPRYPLPSLLHLSDIQPLTPPFHFYYIPTLLNTPKVESITPIHHHPFKEFAHIINSDEIFMQGYCLLNPEPKLP